MLGGEDVSERLLKKYYPYTIDFDYGWDIHMCRRNL